MILAGGGLGGLYQHSINPADLTGSTHFLAAKAGAGLINLEFNQFIPGFLSHPYKTVFREGTLKYCTGLIDSDGRDVLCDYLKTPEAYKHCLDIRETHGPFTSSYESRYFDFALMSCSDGGTIRYSPALSNDPRQYVQDYIRWLQTEHNIDITKDIIRIAPFYHAANGGIAVDHRCETRVAGLFACGEAAGGIHGANRLGGMATGSCLVFGELAGQSACQYAKNLALPVLSASQIRTGMESAYTCCDSMFDDPVSESLLPPDKMTARIRQLMWEYGNVTRTKDKLSDAIREIDMMAMSLNQYSFPKTADVMKAVQFADLSRAMLIAMLNRQESRGSHYREDYPLPDTALPARRIMVEMTGRQFVLKFLRQQCQ